VNNENVQNRTKTRNALQSLAYSPLSAAYRPVIGSSET